jgi:hypothetical protein
MKEIISEEMFKGVAVAELAKNAFSDVDLSAYGDDAEFIAQSLTFFAVQREYDFLYEPGLKPLMEAHDIASARVKADAASTGLPNGVPLFWNHESMMHPSEANDLTNGAYYAIGKHCSDPDAELERLYVHAIEKMRDAVKGMPGPDSGPDGMEAAYA